MNDIIKYWKLLNHVDQTEIRVIQPSSDFKGSEWAKFYFGKTEQYILEACKKHDKKQNIYFGINERTQKGKKAEDVTEVGIFPVDIDCKTKPASEKDLEEADKVADKIIKYLGGEAPTKIFSGNGYQLIYPIPKIEVSDKNRTEINEQVQNMEREIKLKFDNGIVCIDNVGDLPRIMRVPGTYNLRAKRYSKIVDYNTKPNSKLRDLILKQPTQDISLNAPKEVSLSKERVSVDESRSGREFGEVCRLIKKGLSKERIFEKMKAFSKWNDAGEKYREITYKKAKGFQSVSDKPEIGIPQRDTLISTFANKVAEVLADKRVIFYRNDLNEAVEIVKLKNEKQNNFVEHFSRIKPNRFITLIEEQITPGIYVQKVDNQGKVVTINGNVEYEFIKKSIHADLANTVLQSPGIQNKLPRIERIFTVPMPTLYNGELTTPKKGYDERFNSWLVSSAPDITNPEMSLENAKNILANIFKEFCFQSKQDYVNALAGLITPFLRGLYENPNARCPIFFYIGNRERCGKDYCAGITGIVLEGFASEEPPISNSENSKSNNTDELRKKILSALISGRARLHFSNNKGFINNAVFESATTAEKYSDRVLGKNEILSFDNFLEFSMSGNVGVRFTPDLANRSRFIRLFLDLEDANSRHFDNPNLHNWIRSNRGVILSAIYCLIKNWVVTGMKPSSKTFASFPEWARVCGGVMEAAGLDNPCTPDKETLALSGDLETSDMKELFELCYKNNPGKWLTQSEIKEMMINSESNIFAIIDFERKSDVIKFGIKLRKYIGRILSDIRLTVDDMNVRGARQKFKFGKPEAMNKREDIFGHDGHVGHDLPCSDSENGNIYTHIERGATIAEMTNIAKSNNGSPSKSSFEEALS